MARPKKDGKAVNLYLDRKVVDQLEAYCRETGQTKTTAIERMLSSEIEAYFRQPEGRRIPVKEGGKDENKE